MGTTAFFVFLLNFNLYSFKTKWKVVPTKIVVLLFRILLLL
ncbi:hypothetical protein LEP1GSC073_4134 [Leptospira noguchii str. Cascata]|uniref:Uncharacterized protein n=1 Tax=Leptospira noguchii serovar Autumnalis str. ZUN142 TaxID=1085540 RepID=M6UFG7_9LEPT|nr:hypothetical protein LEP1GSC072_3384 [Leptospira noguchii str. Bonito]EMO41546.1 hypothetical protein LEP1GSC186_2156 [Leptospira noguchii serovar Autumnalis str. ZUN142]EMS88076.1 hypothetical protein LEP1GSC073_4134 [Leptospira noguchii str. Cascata]